MKSCSPSSLLCTWTLVLVCCLSVLSLSARRNTSLPALKVRGNQLTDPRGRTVMLHGVMDTPNPYFNRYRWGHEVGDAAVPRCLSYFDRLFTAITDTLHGAHCNVFRLHLDPCWTNDPSVAPSGEEKGEANISQFSLQRLEKYFDLLYWPLIRRAMNHGLYVVVRPPGVCPHHLRSGDAYQQYLLTVWRLVARHDSVCRYAGQISIEMANEPVALTLADGQTTSGALSDYFQPILNAIRKAGFKGIVWAPGTGWQSHYEDYAAHPLRDKNLGYAVHVYPGWYGASDDHCASEDFIRQFGEQVPVSRTHPILISEVDWSPEVPGKGHPNEWGAWVPGNMGTWATASTSRWCRAFKAVLDHYGNLSMTLTSTDDYLDLDAYLRDSTVLPAF
ncbi:MAG: cellulase family glycosylhydrolase, partial [Bacteroidaceae bacterium]|nr:cellulase family glycosylhydrolase [Bacteroidaceae bacterium]